MAIFVTKDVSGGEIRQDPKEYSEDDKLINVMKWVSFRNKRVTLSVPDGIRIPNTENRDMKVKLTRGE